MKYLISILVIFAAAVALGTLLQNTAYVLLVYPPYRVEMSLKLFAVLFLLTLMLAHWLLQLLSDTSRLPALVKKMRQERAQNNSRKLLDVTLRAFFEGRYQEAEKAAVRAIKHGETSVIYPVIAARAAHELGASERRDAHMANAGQRFQGDSTMRLLSDTRNRFGQPPP
jgi:HemY protein